MTRFLRLVSAALLTLALASCASISVDSNTEWGVAQMPKKIYVASFDATHGEFKVDREELELAGFPAEPAIYAADGDDRRSLSKRLDVPTIESYQDQDFHQEKCRG